MEGFSNIPSSGNNTINWNMSSAVTPIASNVGPVSNDQNSSISSVSTNGVLFSKECLHGISSLYEATCCNNPDENCQNNMHGKETDFVSKIVTPTIFESAVKVVKNLFSPAKEQVISQETCARSTNEVEKGILSKKVINSCDIFRQDRTSLHEIKDETSMTNMANEKLIEGSDHSASFTSFSFDGHDNTNDSYTTTVSRIDESFKSTITHFDGNMQCEMEKDLVITEENSLHDSRNDTIRTMENSMNNTIKKNINVSSIKSEDFSNSFEVLGKVKDAEIHAKEYTEDCNVDDLRMKYPHTVKLDLETSEHVSSITSSQEENMPVFRNEEIMTTEVSCSALNKLNSEENTNMENFYANISSKFDELDQKSMENNKKSMVPSPTKFADNEKLDLFPMINPSLENDFLFSPEKSINLKSKGLEKYFNITHSPICLKSGGTNNNNNKELEIFEGKEFVMSATAVSPGEKADEIFTMGDKNCEESGEKRNSILGSESNLHICSSTSTESNPGIVCDPSREIGIPLASQRSYTILNNADPNLCRPVLVDSISDMPAECLNSIILGNCDTSEFNEGILTKNYAKVIDSNVPRKITPYNGIKNSGSENSTVSYINEKPPRRISGNIDNGNVLEFDAGEILSSGLKTPEAECADSNDVSSVVLSGDEPEIRDMLKREALTAGINQTPIINIENAVDVKGKRNPTVLNSVELDGIQNESVIIKNEFDADKSVSSDNGEFVDKKERHNIEKSECIVDINLTSNRKGSKDFQNESFSVNLDIVKINDFEKQDETLTTNHFEMKNDSIFKLNDSLVSCDNSGNWEKTKICSKPTVCGSDTELTQFIQEQFTAFDIEKICSVVDDLPELNLSKNIVIASEKFDKSFHEKTVTAEGDRFTNVNNMSNDKFLPSALDFLDSIKGKGSGRDYSRESLYVKFDPLVQLKHSADILDVADGDKENLKVSPLSKNVATTEPVAILTPVKQIMNSFSPLSPLNMPTKKNEAQLATEKLNKLWELQNEIAKLKELSSQREEMNNERINNYEREIAKLTGRACLLEEKLKESEDIEKSLVKKLNVQNASMIRLKTIVEEYVVYIGKLTDHMETVRIENQKRSEALTEERDYYQNHLQNTEQAFSDVHSKYEKCKKTVEVYKKNEETCKTRIEELKERIELYREKIKQIQDNAAKEMNRLQEKINDIKLNHSQEISRLKAHLRKTELKVQTVQEALDQKVKENQELARICDELIDGKNDNR